MHDGDETHRQRLGANKAIQPVAMPTPFLKRVRNHQLSSPAAGLRESTTPMCQETEGQPPKDRCSLANPSQTQFSLEAEICRLRSSIGDSKRLPLHESVLRALDSLLRATCPRKTFAAAPGSLLAMCLRKIPGYIAELEHWETEDADANGTRSVFNESKVASDVYSDLESFGMLDGWKQLCLVVRAHGVRIVEEAVREGLVEDEVAEVSIRLCLEYMPQMELGNLIGSFLSRQYPDPSSDDDSLLGSEPALRPLRILKYCDIPGSSFMLGKLAHLLNSGSLPASWILTSNFRSMWASTARQLAGRAPDGYQGIADFVATIIELLCFKISARAPKDISEEGRRDKEKAQKMLTGAISALASMVLLGQEGETPDQLLHSIQESRTAVLSRRILCIIQTCTSRVQRARRATRGDLGIYLLRLSAFLSLDATDSAPVAVAAAWQDALSGKDNHNAARLYDVTLALVGTIAYNCSRGTGLSPNDYLSMLCDKLSTLHLPGDPLQNLQVDGAFFLAEHTGDLRDLAFAESLRAASQSRKTGRQPKRQVGTLRDDKPTASYAWDEDIGEWIITTGNPVAAPVTAPKRATRSSLAGGTTNIHLTAKSFAFRPCPRSIDTSSITEIYNEDYSSAFDDSETDHASEDEDSDENHEQAQSHDTPATETSVASLSSSPEPVETPGRAVLPDLRRRPDVGFRRPSKPPPREDTSDELAPDDNNGDDKENRHTWTRPATRRRTGSSGGSLLCLQPAGRPTRVMAEDYYDQEGSSDDELSFV